MQLLNIILKNSRHKGNFLFFFCLRSFVGSLIGIFQVWILFLSWLFFFSFSSFYGENFRFPRSGIGVKRRKKVFFNKKKTLRKKKWLQIRRYSRINKVRRYLLWVHFFLQQSPSLIKLLRLQWINPDLYQKLCKKFVKKKHFYLPVLLRVYLRRRLQQVKHYRSKSYYSNHKTRRYSFPLISKMFFRGRCHMPLMNLSGYTKQVSAILKFKSMRSLFYFATYVLPNVRFFLLRRVLPYNFLVSFSTNLLLGQDFFCQIRGQINEKCYLHFSHKEFLQFINFAFEGAKQFTAQLSVVWRTYPSWMSPEFWNCFSTQGIANKMASVVTDENLVIEKLFKAACLPEVLVDTLDQILKDCFRLAVLEEQLVSTLDSIREKPTCLASENVYSCPSPSLNKIQQLLAQGTVITNEIFLQNFQNDWYLNQLLENHGLTYEIVLNYFVSDLENPLLQYFKSEKVNLQNEVATRLQPPENCRLACNTFVTRVIKSSLYSKFFLFFNQQKQEFLKNYNLDEGQFFELMLKLKQIFNRSGLTCLVLFPQLQVGDRFTMWNFILRYVVVELARSITLLQLEVEQQRVTNFMQDIRQLLQPPTTFSAKWYRQKFYCRFKKIILEHSFPRKTTVFFRVLQRHVLTKRFRTCVHPAREWKILYFYEDVILRCLSYLWQQKLPRWRLLRWFQKLMQIKIQYHKKYIQKILVPYVKVLKSKRVFWIRIKGLPDFIKFVDCVFSHKYSFWQNRFYFRKIEKRVFYDVLRFFWYQKQRNQNLNFLRICNDKYKLAYLNRVPRSMQKGLLRKRKWSTISRLALFKKKKNRLFRDLRLQIFSMTVRKI